MLASMPPWLDGAPDWAEENWKLLQGALPREDDWQVWIDWYNRRLHGVLETEEIEFVFASVPEEVRKTGPAAATDGSRSGWRN